MITFDVTPPGVPLMTADDWIALGLALGRELRRRAPGTVGMAFVLPQRMRELNARYRGLNRPTDVLSFAATPLPSKSRTAPSSHLGDIVVCAQVAKAEAKRRGISPREEYVRLVIHGVLHLTGMDHATAADEARMFARQERCVERFLAPL